MTRLHREDAGFTLVELLISMTLGLLILGAATMITVGAGRHSTEVAQRDDATQAGRLVLERVETLLRSQVCAGTTLPMQSATTTSMTFFADTSDGSALPVRHALTFNAAAGTLSDVATPVTSVSPSITYGTASTDVYTGKLGTDGTNSFFRYYAYPAAAPATGAVQPDQELVPSGTSSLSSTDLKTVAKIDVNFVVKGTTKTKKPISVPMSDRIFVRLANPNSASTITRPFDPSCA